MTSDVVLDVSGGRRPALEMDLLTIGGLDFEVLCAEAPGRHRLHEAGTCPGFRIGDRLDVLYVPRRNGRQRLVTLQIRR